MKEGIHRPYKYLKNKHKKTVLGFVLWVKVSERIGLQVTQAGTMCLKYSSRETALT
jgi:hypothetical protein